MPQEQTIISRLVALAARMRSRHERQFFLTLLCVGFVFDAALLPRIDATSTYILLGTYFLVLTCAIMLSTVLTERMPHYGVMRRMHLFLDFIVPLLMGSLLSAIAVYYSRSASVFVSAPFLLMLFVILVSTELARSRFAQLELRIVLLHFILYMGMIFAAPVFFGEMGPRIFIISGFITTLLMAVIILMLMFVAMHTMRRIWRVVAVVIFSTTLCMNALYFFHIIPPIPLSLRVAIVNYGVSRLSDGDYQVFVGSPESPLSILKGAHVMHAHGAPLSIFTEVFAPTKLGVNIVHEWQYKNIVTGNWATKRSIAFPITGGRSLGYRGYSTVEVFSGEWRVRVKTENDEVLGVEYFTVMGGAPEQLTSKIL